MVRVLLLAAGYGTRLQRDLEEDGGRLYSHLRGLPKALVPVGHRPLASHWLEAANGAGAELYIVTNAAHHQMFVRWAVNSGLPPSRVVSDGTRTNETRLGAVADMELAVRRLGLGGDDLVVVGGDTLFKGGFSLAAFLAERAAGPGAAESAALWYEDEEVEKRGVLELDGDGRVAGFLEKPRREDTESRKACPCFYLYTPAALALLPEYLEAVRGRDRRLADSPGHFLAWAHTRVPVRAVRVEGRYDIGGLASYVEANRELRGDGDAAARAIKRGVSGTGSPLGGASPRSSEDGGDGDGDGPPGCPADVPWGGVVAAAGLAVVVAAVRLIVKR